MTQMMRTEETGNTTMLPKAVPEGAFDDYLEQALLAGRSEKSSDWVEQVTLKIPEGWVGDRFTSKSGQELVEVKIPNQEGANGMDRSYRFQVETYHGIFEESEIYKKMMKPVADGKMIPNQDMGGYRCDMMDELERFYPVIDAKQVEIIHSGKLTMHKHSLIGVYTQMGVVMELPPEELKTVFASSERVNAAMMKQSGW